MSDLAVTGTDMSQVLQAISEIVACPGSPASFCRKIEAIESVLKTYSQIDIPVNHKWSKESTWIYCSGR